MSAPERIRLGAWITGAVFLAGGGVILLQPGGIGAARSMAGWWGEQVHRKISPEQNPEGPTYDDTANGPVALSVVIARTRASWPGESVAVVHGVAADVGAGLLHRTDIEVGSLVNGKFVPWSLSPWQAEQKLRADLMAQTDFVSDEGRYVFRRKPARK